MFLLRALSILFRSLARAKEISGALLVIIYICKDGGLTLHKGEESVITYISENSLTHMMSER